MAAQTQVAYDLLQYFLKDQIKKLCFYDLFLQHLVASMMQ